MKWIASFDKYPYAQVMALQTDLGFVAGGQTDIFTNGKSGFELSGPWVGAQNVPTSNPDLEGNFGVESFPGVPRGRARSGKATSTSSPRPPLTRLRPSSSSPGSPATTTRASSDPSTRRADGYPPAPR